MLNLQARMSLSLTGSLRFQTNRFTAVRGTGAKQVMIVLVVIQESEGSIRRVVSWIPDPRGWRALQIGRGDATCAPNVALLFGTDQVPALFIGRYVASAAAIFQDHGHR